MLLDRIDIDAHGPLHRVELGPFAEHLNVVCGPEGSGKTAIARFVRDALASRDYPLGMLSSSTGRVVLADRNGLVHCRREQDGTAQGRSTVEFESRGDQDRHFGSFEGSWFNGLSASSDSSRAIRSIQLPESIVDGVVTDTAVTSVARVVSACVRSGLDSHEAYHALPLREDSLYVDRDGYVEPANAYGEQRYDRNRRLREQLAEVESELGRLGDKDGDYDSLVARRNWLKTRLAEPHRPRRRSESTASADRARHRQWQQRLTELHDRARQLCRQAELRRWIAEIDRDAADHTRYVSHRTVADYSSLSGIADSDLRRQLDDLDAQMIRWRRTLVEIRGLRTALLSGHGHSTDVPLSPLDESSLRRVRLDGFLHAVDRYDRSRSWTDLYPENYRPLHHIDDIDHRIESATRQIDWLLERYAGPDKPNYAWYETLPESVHHRPASTLGETLRAIREELRHVQHHTARGVHHPSYRAAGELEELRRSEQWLVASIGQLNRHRESLLQHHVTASAGRVVDGPREPHHDHFVLSRERSASIAQLDRTTVDLDACLREAAELRRSMRSLPVIDTVRYDDHYHDETFDRDAWVAELRRIDDRLASSSRVQWLRKRRSQLLEQLHVVRPVVNSKSPLAEAASRWVVRLSAGRLQRIDWPLNHFAADPKSYHRDRYQRSGVTINGRDESECPAADRSIAAIAVRLAAGDLLARTGRHVPLVFETHREMFDITRTPNAYALAPLAYYEHGEHLRSNHPIAAALRDYSRDGRQVVVLTSNQDLKTQLSRVGALNLRDSHSTRGSCPPTVVANSPRGGRLRGPPSAHLRFPRCG